MSPTMSKSLMKHLPSRRGLPATDKMRAAFFATLPSHSSSSSPADLLPSVASSPAAMAPPAGHEHIARGIGRMTELVFERGEGSWVWTAGGDKFLDMTCGIGVTNTGHCKLTNHTICTPAKAQRIMINPPNTTLFFASVVRRPRWARATTPWIFAHLEA